ncbi:MAG: MBL fold metallo-hydrolase [Candidatus Lokiarchaeota archaeon]|nr:MBL fold metallo-hydrolase [Candidatus Lokiarchaeota archaeon]
MSDIRKGMEGFFGRGKFERKPFSDGVCYFIGAFGNVGVVKTSEGLVLFDLALRLFGPQVFKAVREFSDKQVKYIVLSHGHFDHCLGFAPFVEEAKKNGWVMPQVIGHENLLRRFEKYRMLDQHQMWTFRQQFASVGVNQSRFDSVHDALEPTIIMRSNEPYEFKLGNQTFELYHDKGETDDSIWMYLPEKKVLFTGDLMVNSYPNIGSPFRVQRYAKNWALAMEKMMDKNAEYLLPGHGPLFEQKDDIRDVLSITAEAMHFVHDEVVKRLNEGKWFEEIYHEMLEIYPEKFNNHERLRPLYGEYRFAIHDVYRLYHGWYDSGNPTALFPSKSEEIAKELLKITNQTNYFNRARELFEEGKFQLALHLLDVVIKGTNESSETLIDACKLKVKILKNKTGEEMSFIAKNILISSANQLKAKMKELRKNSR